MNYTWAWGANVNIYYPGHGQAGRVDCNLSTGTGNQLMAEQVYFYPNPVNDILSIVAERSISKFVLSDSLGKICATGQVNSNQFDINLSSHPQGIYFVTLHDDAGKTFTGKVLKQ